MLPSGIFKIISLKLNLNYLLISLNLPFKIQVLRIKLISRFLENIQNLKEYSFYNV